MAIDKILGNGDLDSVADSVFSAVSNSVSEVKAMQQRKAAENVQLVVQALKKIEGDLRQANEEVANQLATRIASIKDGKDGKDGSNAKDGRDGRPGRDGAKGDKGDRGLDGRNGIDGKDGVSVTDAKIDFDGSLIITLSTGQEINVGEVVSPDLADKIQVISTMSTNGAVGIKDEGTSISTGVKNINFVGATVTATNSGDDVTVNVSAGTGTVTSVAVSGGTTGLTTSGGPITTTGTITLAGTLAVANGGTGVTTSTGTTNVVLSNSPTLVTPALGTPSALVGTNITGTAANFNINGTVGATTPAAGAFTSLSDSGNLTFTGTGNRITGDFSGASTARVMVQSSTVNGVTSFGLLPNGTGASSTYTAFSNSDPTNSNGIQLNANLTANRIVGIANGSSSAVPITFGQGATEQMRIDTSGNVGIGTSSPVTYGRFAVVSNGDYAPSATFISNSSAANWARADWDNVNVAYNGIIYQDQGGLFNIRNDGANAIAFLTNGGNERMRITSTGDVGIGTSSPSSYSSLGNRLVVGDGAGNEGITIATGTGDNGSLLFADGTSGSAAFAGYVQYDHSDNSMKFGTNGSERARIDSSGNLLVNTTTNTYSSRAVFYNAANTVLHSETGSTGTSNQILFLNPNGIVGSITTNGSATLYNVTSDQRLKENIQDADSASSLIDSLQVRKFDWKADSSHQRYGFVAQELVTVAPEAVHQPTDTEQMMAVDYSKLVPMLVKEIQSLRQRLAAAGI